MRLSALISLLIGIAIVVALVMMNGATGIEQGIARAGWGIAAVVAMHLPQVFLSAQAWRAVASSPLRPSGTIFCGLRWIREAVNGLLPVAQIGGHLVAARLLALSGVPLNVAGASVTVDLTLEMLSQVAFTLVGLGLLVTGPGETGLPHGVATATIATLLALVMVFILAQRFGMFRLFEAALLRLAQKPRWKKLEEVAGLHRTIVELHKSPRRLMLSAGLHFLSWLAGGLEVLVTLHVLGIEGGLREALIIESVGQAFRAVGFAVPGGLGVQEGGVILICGLLGISPQGAIELSLLRRIRELSLGVPGLLVWSWIEHPRFARSFVQEEFSREKSS